MTQIEKKLIESACRDLAMILKASNILDYTWIGTVGSQEFRIKVSAYDRKEEPNNNVNK